MFECADRIVLLENGEIVFDGTPRAMAVEMDFKGLPVIGPQHVALTQELVKAGFPRDIIEPSLKETIRKLDELTGPIDPAKGRQRPLSSTRGVTPEPMIRFDHVTFAYPNGSTALDDISLEFREGDFVLLSGWNGSGKTTLAKHLNGLLRP
jgi:ABC-type multidrug transport system fused ATPase/permease subunit